VDVMEEDTEILDEIEQKRQKKSFHSIINKSKFSQFELDEVMSEA
jgi:hypothetical protein